MPGEFTNCFLISDDVIANIHVMHMALREREALGGGPQFLGFGVGTYTQSTTEVYIGFWFDVDGEHVLLEPQLGNTIRHFTDGKSDIVKYHLHHGIELTRMSSEQALKWVHNK